MEYLICALIGYFIGVINPAYLIGKIKGRDIRKEGSHNAGGSNALIIFGKAVGFFCIAFDIGKAMLAVIVAEAIFPDLTHAFAVSVAGTACILGHMFPFYLKFKGGKGTASLGGIVIIYNWRVALAFLCAEIIIVLVSDYLCLLPITLSTAFPVVFGVMESDVIGAMIIFIATIAILLKNIENIIRISKGTEAHFSFLWNKNKEIERVQSAENR